MFCFINDRAQEKVSTAECGVLDMNALSSGNVDVFKNYSYKYLIIFMIIMSISANFDKI